MSSAHAHEPSHSLLACVAAALAKPCVALVDILTTRQVGMYQRTDVDYLVTEDHFVRVGFALTDPYR